MLRTAWPALVLTALLLTTACAQRDPAGASPATPGAPTSPSAPVSHGVPAAPAEGLVIEVAHTGGFVTPEMLASRLPLVSVHADGRVITQGPRIEIFPPPALPALQVQHVDEDAVGAQEVYVPDTVAGVVTAWQDPQDGPEPRPAPWPGPLLPGEPLEPRLGLSCVLATGEQAEAVLDAAGTADTLTPWVSEDGERWSVALRPLLPHEEGCADLADR